MRPPSASEWHVCEDFDPFRNVHARIEAHNNLIKQKSLALTEQALMHTADIDAGPSRRFGQFVATESLSSELVLQPRVRASEPTEVEPFALSKNNRNRRHGSEYKQTDSSHTLEFFSEVNVSHTSTTDLLRHCVDDAS